MTESIVLQVCRELKVDTVDFFSRKTDVRLVNARRMAIDRLKAAGFSQAGIARMIRRNYSTVRYWTKPGYREKHSKYYAAYNASKRAAADVRQAIIAPRREHSRKPDGIHERVERLVSGPYLELFARQQRPNWTVWGNQTDKFAEAAE